MQPHDMHETHAQSLAADTLDAIEEGLLDLIATVAGRLVIEVRPAARDRRRILITAGPTNAVTLPATDLGPAALARLDQRRSTRPAGPAGNGRPRSENGPDDLETGDLPPASAESAAPSRRYLTALDVARRYGITTAAVRQRLRRGQLPPPLPIGKRRLWRETDLDRFDDDAGRHPRARRRPRRRRPPTGTS